MKLQKMNSGLSPVNQNNRILLLDALRGFAISKEITQQLVANTAETYSGGTFAEAIKARLKEYQILFPAVLLFYPVVLGMFLFGVWAARKGIIANYTEHLGFFRKAFWWGLSIGVIFSGLYAYTFQIIKPNMPYGFGLFGKVELWHGILLTILIFSLQIPFSIFWLKRFRFGPFEWLWRSFTYKKIQPFWD